jgi:hypothetical protein
MSRQITARTLARLSVMALLLSALGCDGNNGPCPPDDSFVVEEQGTCSSTHIGFNLSTTGCRISLDGGAASGLPGRGAMGQNPQPLRQGGFILFTDDPAPFRLCRAKRVAFRLELTCFDAQGVPACNATLTEPGP